ncbi:hypothetical protein SynBIOSE41_00379 [Synechococcus sp. BIOS-E4-1]|nr:hypothetical protein SynBIOSE41_00379 [Synechococcus sp. BIOS-E4-1]
MLVAFKKLNVSRLHSSRDIAVNSNSRFSGRSNRIFLR